MIVGILTASDKGAAGQREDESGQVIRRMMEPLGAEVAEYAVLPDDRDRLSAAMRHMADDLKCDLILTTGGTGFSPRDVTPEATLDVVERLTPGLTEAMRVKGMEATPRAMLSRAAAGIRGQTLIVNLPGSPKAVRENLSVILPVLSHGMEMLTGRGGECAAAD
ncbi:MAG: MogA/MoaB family molybdenum cofactor biosynthesis protein [Peptococcaceae bacterium]|jgi:molybdenum cofactor synthesis domain-containing protein|nr:MogA/MoaB family molybdenum cofactor biosynthesis protein [Peptococcaceae bacterium]